MGWSRGSRVARASAPGISGLPALLAATCAVMLAGCNTDGQPVASIATPRGATVAFESIDGPPPAVFRKLVADLNDEAQTRRLPVVSREGPAVYRVRGYLSAHIMKGRTAIAWVWDVYDETQHRTLRISGEEQGDAERRTWAVADDAVLHKIAQKSVEQLAAFLAAPVDSPPAPSELAIAFAGFGDDELTPESAGIFRLDRAKADAAADETGEARREIAAAAGLDGAIPLPPRRPDGTATVASAAETLALAASAR